MQFVPMETWLHCCASEWGTKGSFPERVLCCFYHATRSHLSAAQKDTCVTFWDKNTLSLGCGGAGLHFDRSVHFFHEQCLLYCCSLCWSWLWSGGSQDSWTGSSTLHSFWEWYARAWTDPHKTDLNLKKLRSYPTVVIGSHFWEGGEFFALRFTKVFQYNRRWASVKVRRTCFHQIAWLAHNMGQRSSYPTSFWRMIEALGKCRLLSHQILTFLALMKKQAFDFWLYTFIYILNNTDYYFFFHKVMVL